jgi:hypothetical protein
MPIKIETDEEYHSGEGVSKSTLWKQETKTPYLARFGKKQDADHFAYGKAGHIAILEPETFEARVSRGPDVRRNTREWKLFEDFCNSAGTIPLKGEDYDNVLTIRDLADGLPAIEIMRNGTPIVETSAYHFDEETGVLVKTRPDMYNHGIILDLKVMADASPFAFQRSVGKFGYHMQHALYSDVWEKGSEMPVDAFFFVVFEKSSPPQVAVYELTPASIAEGHARYRHALAKYAEYLATDNWPSYPLTTQKLGLRKYDYRLTEPPEIDETIGDDDVDDEEEATEE